MTSAIQRKRKRNLLYDKQGGFCYYCLQFVKREKATLEHLKPKSQGGTSTYTNIAMACQSCNKKRDVKNHNIFARKKQKRFYRENKNG